jgi:hypothetical protein
MPTAEEAHAENFLPASRKQIKKEPEERRERFPSQAELERVVQVLREMEAEGVELPSAIAAVRLLMLDRCSNGSRVADDREASRPHTASD